MEGLDRIDGIFRRQWSGVEWKAMERGGMFVGERGEVDGGGLGGLLRVFGKEVLG